MPLTRPYTFRMSICKLAVMCVHMIRMFLMKLRSLKNIFDKNSSKTQTHTDKCSQTQEALESSKVSNINDDNREHPFNAWQTTPGEIIEIIFSHLDEQTRCKASLVCKDWRNVFFSPSLWHTKCFTFKDENALKYEKFLEQLGKHVCHMTLVFGCPETEDSVVVIMTAFQNFVTQVNKCSGIRLQSLTVQKLYVYFSRTKSSIHHGKVIYSLCLLLRKQSYLKSVDLSEVNCLWSEGTRVLEAAACDSENQPKKSLCNLNISGFFQLFVPMPNNAKFACVMGCFVALSRLRIDKEYLNEAVLDKLTTSSAHTLRSIELYVDDRPLRGNTKIKPGAWLAVTERCPQVKVTVEFHNAFNEAVYSMTLVQNMPLTEVMFTWESNFKKFDHALYTIEDLEESFDADYEITTTLKILPEERQAHIKALPDLLHKCLALRKMQDETVESLPRALDNVMSVLSSGSRNERWGVRHVVTDVTIDCWRALISYLRMKWPAISIEDESTSGKASPRPEHSMIYGPLRLEFWNKNNYE